MDDESKQIDSAVSATILIRQVAAAMPKRTPRTLPGLLGRMTDRGARIYAFSHGCRVLGWWVVRQRWSRAELVEAGWVGRRRSYASEREFQQFFGKEVGEVTWDDVRAFIGLEEPVRSTEGC